MIEYKVFKNNTNGKYNALFAGQGGENDISNLLSNYKEVMIFCVPILLAEKVLEENLNKKKIKVIINSVILKKALEKL